MQHIAFCCYVCKLLLKIYACNQYRVVSDVVADLKELAVDIGGELDHQNFVTDRIAEKTDINNVHLNQTNRRIVKLS